MNTMQIVRTISDCRDRRRSLGADVAFVPTMGALHAGHLSLIEAARKLARHIIVSIFVNPTQFAPHEDFSRYPRPIEDDLRLCREAGVDLVFNPEPAEIYPAGAPRMQIELPDLFGVLEGVHRPGHFSGVCLVVAKLFNIVQPSIACFGEKDYQQLAVLRAMSRALDFPLDIVGCPTLRDPDGLAMSSRNRYLSPAERRRALAISRGLFLVRDLAHAGEHDARRLRDTLEDALRTTDQPDIAIDLQYAAITDIDTLQPVDRINPRAQALVAMKVGNTRLIDNVRLQVPS